MIGFPIFYLLSTSLLFELNSKGILSLSLSPLFYVASILWILSGIGMQKMKHWSWYTFCSAQIVVTYLNAVALVYYSDSGAKTVAFTITLLIHSYLYFVVKRHLRVPYIFPDIQWWQSGLAAMHHFPVEVFHLNSPSGTSKGQLLDINLKGCFVKSPKEFEPFEKITLRMIAYGQEVDIPGTVVWNANSTVTHPKGVGVQFSVLDRKKKRKLRVLSRRFIKEKDAQNVTAVLSS